MKEKEIIIGIDVSKANLDVCILVNQTSESYRIKNDIKSIRTFLNKVKKKNKDSEIAICMENTGYYNWPSYNVIESMQLNLFVVNPLHLKKSMGLIRGKNDTIDALRIAKFLMLNKSELKQTLIPRKQLRIMQALVAQRNRLVESKKRFKVPTAELVFIADKELSDKIKRSSQKIIKELEEQILKIENQIDTLIQTDTELKQQFDFIVSVQGVGKVLAWSILIKTNEFKSINNPRKLACYAGVVPFDFQSGSSIYKKPRVSLFADKSLKKLLHLAAMRSVQLKGDLQTYYKRKVLEGKNKMLVLNAIRNKIVARICSVVNNRRNYVINLDLS